MFNYIEKKISIDSGKEPLTDIEIDILFEKENTVFSGHYPDYPVYPASLVIGICCDIICKAKKSTDFHLLTYKVSKSTFNAGIRPGDTANFKFIFTKDQAIIQTTITVNDETIVNITFKPSSKIPETHINTGEIIEEKPVSAIKILPQRYPLLAVDSIIETNVEGIGSAIKHISYNDYCYRKINQISPATEDLIYPAGAIIEGIEQSAALLLERHWDISKGHRTIVIGGLSDIDFFNIALPGDTIQFYSSVDYISEDNAILSGIAMVNDQVIMSIGKIFVISK